MDARVFRQHEQAVRRAYVSGLGGGRDPLAAGAVTVAARPAEHWGYEAVGVSFADATLFSVAPDWEAQLRAVAPSRHEHHRVMLDVLSKVRDDANADGADLTLHAPAVCWALGSVPGPRRLPPGHRFATVDAAWLNDQIDDGRFENGAGETSGVDGRLHRNLYGVAVLDPAGEVVALAGTFLTYGLHEIGVDVVPDRQGEGLGVAVVAEAVREILARGATPFYGCNPTNVRSMRTALSVGFVPVCADTSITR